MEGNQLMLMLQLVNKLDESAKDFEKAYNSSDKEKFDLLKKTILELQKKIEFILK